MGLDMWFREDVTRILALTLEVQRNAARALAPLDTEAAATYQRGFVDALLAVAVGFGVRAPSTAVRVPKEKEVIKDPSWR